MRTVERIVEVRAALETARAAGSRVGFVPTMGALHDGHLSLIRRARGETDVVVVSVFVNPAQFGPHEDLAAYPRTLEADVAACASEGVDVVFVPSASEMYPDAPQTSVSVPELAATMEGAHRPGHFDGVALVCTKLFSIVGRCTAYFGEKDAQQLRVIRRLVRDLDLPVEIVGCPTIRDADGLALSSRNAYLSSDERRRALALPAALRRVAELVSDGQRDPAVLVGEATRVLERDVDAVDYVAVVDPDTLAVLPSVDGAALVCAAVRVGRTRLIDNVTVVPAAVGAQRGGR